MPDDLESQQPVIVTMPREIDAGNASAVGDTLDAAVAQGTMTVVVDCTPMIFCDSVGFNTLLLINQKARSAQAELLFVIAPNSHLRRVLELLEMQDVLAVYPSIDAAITASQQLPRALVHPGQDGHPRRHPLYPGGVVPSALSARMHRRSRTAGGHRSPLDFLTHIKH